MPLYIADYLRDTRRLHAREHGAYLLLIMEYWTAGSLPSDDGELARLAALSDREWREVRPKIVPFFGPDWTHARIDRELSEAKDKYERRAKAGKEGGKAKAAGKQKPSNASSNARPGPQAEHLANGKPGSTNHNHSTSYSSEANASGGEPPLVDPAIERRDLFRRGKEVLGSGGVVTELLKAKGGNVALTRAAVEQASQAENAREYVGRIIRPKANGGYDNEASVVSAGHRLVERMEESERLRPEDRCAPGRHDVRLLAQGGRG